MFNFFVFVVRKWFIQLKKSFISWADKETALSFDEFLATFDELIGLKTKLFSVLGMLFDGVAFIIWFIGVRTPEFEPKLTAMNPFKKSLSRAEAFCVVWLGAADGNVGLNGGDDNWDGKLIDGGIDVVVVVALIGVFFSGDILHCEREKMV